MSNNFAYKVQDQQGNVHEGTLEGSSRDAVAGHLKEKGYTVLDVAEEKVPLGQMEFQIGKPKIKLKDLAVFARQFATMVDSGMSLMRTLNILAEQTENKGLADVIDEIRQDVEAGNSLSSAMADHDDVFPPLFIAMVRAGETAGLLDEVLARVAKALEKEVRLKAKIKSAMTYPVLMAGMSVILTAVMLIFIVPQFQGMFDQLGGELPLPTAILVMISNFITSPVGLAMIFLGPPAAIFGIKKAKATEDGKRFFDKLKLKAPVFGDLFHKMAMSRFTRNLGALMKAGVPILQALEITAETVDNAPIADAVDEVQQAVREGEQMAPKLGEFPVFPPMVVQMISVGEETGAIDSMLVKIADFYDEEVETTTEALTSLIEPLMIMGLGGLIGGMVVALYMPIFKVIEMVGGGA